MRVQLIAYLICFCNKFLFWGVYAMHSIIYSHASFSDRFTTIYTSAMSTLIGGRCSLCGKVQKAGVLSL